MPVDEALRVVERCVEEHGFPLVFVDKDGNLDTYV
jgi:hypothetical protein